MEEERFTPLRRKTNREIGIGSAIFGLPQNSWITSFRTASVFFHIAPQKSGFDNHRLSSPLKKMKVIVASKNPVKISSTQVGFEKIFIDKSFEFEGVDVPSGVSDQPMTDAETLQGATNRAMNARASHPNADFWVGIEGGLDQTPQGLLAFAWVVILSTNQSGQSRTSTFHLPPKVAELINQGIELGFANDQVFSEHNSKQKGGAVGSLTKGVLGRSAYYEQPVMLALVPFLNPEMYPINSEKA